MTDAEWVAKHKEMGYSPIPVTEYDYTHQAWVVNGLYVTCGHVDYCDCFGRLHAGEPVIAGSSIH